MRQQGQARMAVPVGGWARWSRGTCLSFSHSSSPSYMFHILTLWIRFPMEGIWKTLCPKKEDKKESLWRKAGVDVRCQRCPEVPYFSLRRHRDSADRKGWVWLKSQQSKQGLPCVENPRERLQDRWYLTRWFVFIFLCLPLHTSSLCPGGKFPYLRGGGVVVGSSSCLRGTSCPGFCLCESHLTDVIMWSISEYCGRA